MPMSGEQTAHEEEAEAAVALLLLSGEQTAHDEEARQALALLLLLSSGGAASGAAAGDEGYPVLQAHGHQSCKDGISTASSRRSCISASIASG